MLDIAQKYTEELKQRFLEITYDEKYMYYNNGYSDEYEPSDSTWNKHEFVSVTKEGKLIGYIGYDIDRNSYNVTNLEAINFTDHTYTFGKDLMQVVTDMFYKYNFNKLNFGVYMDNPIMNSYDNMIKKYGGKEIGIKRRESKLLDGKYHDYKLYEILREDYIKPNYTK